MDSSLNQLSFVTHLFTDSLLQLATWYIQCAMERSTVQPNIGGDWREISEVTGLTLRRKVKGIEYATKAAKGEDALVRCAARSVSMVKEGRRYIPLIQTVYNMIGRL